MAERWGDKSRLRTGESEAVTAGSGGCVGRVSRDNGSIQTGVHAWGYCCMAKQEKRDQAAEDQERREKAAAERFSGQAFVPAYSGTIKERVQRRAAAAAFDAANRGDVQPGIDLGISPDPKEEAMGEEA